MLAMLIALMMQAQGPIVGNAAFVEWDYPAGGTETAFNIRCGSGPGVDRSAPPVATVPSGTQSWPIQALSGQQYCDVTAFDAAADIESGPSNEVAFFVFPPPTGARVRVSALSENLRQLEQLGQKGEEEFELESCPSDLRDIFVLDGADEMKW